MRTLYFFLSKFRHHCLSCGGAYVSELSRKEFPLLHHGIELSVRLCDRCRSCQELLAVLRCHNALLLMYSREVIHVQEAFHELTGKKNVLGCLAVPQADICLENEEKSEPSSAESMFSSEELRDDFIIRHCKRWFNTTQEGNVFNTLKTKEFLELIAVKQLAFSDKVKDMSQDAASLIRLLYDNITDKGLNKSCTCNDLSSFRLVLEALSAISKGQTTNDADVTTTTKATTTATAAIDAIDSDIREEYQFEDSSIDFNIPQLLHIFFLLLPANLSARTVQDQSTPPPPAAAVEESNAEGEDGGSSETVVSSCSLCGAVEQLIKLEVHALNCLIVYLSNPSSLNELIIILFF